MHKNLCFSFILLFAISNFAFASEKTICGSYDDRIPSRNPKIARVQKREARAGCTLTMIGRACAISAGHCTSTFEVAEFNTPASRNGRIQHPGEEDIYSVDKNSIVYESKGIGNDYAVLRLLPNSITGMLAGDAQGFYEVSFQSPLAGYRVRITGYGSDSGDESRNYAQQTNAGIVDSMEGTVLRHRVDTMGGNSGSSVIDDFTDKIIGIHTHGGCFEDGGANSATLIATHEKLQEAILNCLEWEETNL